MDRTSYQLQGQNGGIVLSGTDAWTASANNAGVPARGFLVVMDTVLSALGSNIVDGDAKLIDTTLVVGLYIPGQVTAVTLNSGAIILIY